MKVVQTVFGVFHHFELARELERRGHLERVYSTWPWARLAREGLPRERVDTFPWWHVPEHLLHRAGLEHSWVTNELSYWNALQFDRWVLKRLEALEKEPDALIGISGTSLEAGRLVQERGGVFICDRGSTHHRHQAEVVADEHRRWGSKPERTDDRDTAREEAIYEQADAITVPSRIAKQSFERRGVPAAKVHVIPYGVRLESFRPLAEPPRDEFCVLFAGGVSLRKGVPYLLEAFARLRHPKKRLRVAGPMMPDGRAVLGRLPVEGVEFPGALSQAALAELMSRSHVLVLPSVEEGLALVQAQALACGCPVICSDKTGCEDLFTDGVEGFVVPVRDSGAIAERMQRMADDPALQGAMREAALRRVQAIGGWQEYGDRWETLLRELTGKS